jgi:hypothetical protein
MRHFDPTRLTSLRKRNVAPIDTSRLTNLRRNAEDRFAMRRRNVDPFSVSTTNPVKAFILPCGLTKNGIWMLLNSDV